MYIRNGILAVCALFVVSCGQSPVKTIEKDCVRLDLFAEIDSKADARASCKCFAGKMEDTLSEKELKLLAKTFHESKTTDDFDQNAKKNGLSDMTAMNMLGAAKSCAAQ